MSDYICVHCGEEYDYQHYCCNDQRTLTQNVCNYQKCENIIAVENEHCLGDNVVYCHECVQEIKKKHKEEMEKKKSRIVIDQLIAVRKEKGLSIESMINKCGFGSKRFIENMESEKGYVDADFYIEDLATHAKALGLKIKVSFEKED